MLVGAVVTVVYVALCLDYVVYVGVLVLCSAIVGVLSM